MFSIPHPLPYTSSQLLLALQDLYLFARITFVWPITAGIPSIVLPLLPFRSGSLDELSPGFWNIVAVVLHAVLILAQSVFLVVFAFSFLLGVPLPLFAWTPTCIVSLVVVVQGNNLFCVLLNGTSGRWRQWLGQPPKRFSSLVRPDWPDTSDEKWVFINGVAVGEHWMQSNLDRLALTFRRPIHGIHNRTGGIIFDVIETIMQRTFGYATPSVRDIYADLQRFIQEVNSSGARKYEKIVLIVHSQGSVEAGMALDWLFDTADRSLLERLEVYTFGNAANHFCNPRTGSRRRLIKHVEHYANLGDYVAKFGILHFRPLPARRGERSRTAAEDEDARRIIEKTYVGRLFVRQASGHLLNGNYLDNFFTMNRALTSVLEENDFMDSELNEELLTEYDIASRSSERYLWDCKEALFGTRKIKEVSQLWRYRNGGRPVN